ncbi:myotubularin-related protein 6-like, partial [Tropilaelaps mercedesae]
SSSERSSSSVVVGNSSKTKASGTTIDSRGLRQQQQPVGAVALEWISLRKAVQCSCTLPVDSALRKFHCWSCGGVFCGRCLDRQLALPGHLSGRSVTVCRGCFKALTKTNSIEYDNNT